ncbi:MAG: hypothetical protein A2V81_04510 [Candidatus Abawacabacteria bacterium RBG_16_42_10]|uniref:Uncharacterized protein n=1 Tax=Candidatus Abawacabacteria bacterium RBG_16_42_10 TaxID=1817814 RepID=A0A1F4XJH1_9BACT|nr:MAG: hypothetical protein A2V81_04510 [Candidatus Abawacabacteria bacterium RBG_16_42_10]
MAEENSQQQAASQGDQGTPPVDPMAPLFPVGKSQDPRDDECLSIFSDEETKAKHAALVNHAIATNNLKFDQKRVLELVSGSYSLTYAEKIYFLDIAIAKITQEQIDQLIQVFESEQVRFAKLHQDHQKKMKEIEEKYKEAQAKGENPKLESEKKEAKKKDEAMVEDILKNLD